MTTATNADIAERFVWHKVTVTGFCWLWNRPTGKQGYGRFGANKKSHLAHRFVYQLLVGPIPPGMQIDHLCRIKNCVNPDHLEPVTSKENNRRRVQFITHCPDGHEYNASNTRLDTKGCKVCKKCAVKYTTKSRIKMKARSN